MKPIHEVWVSIDSCQEHWGWEDIEELDERVEIPDDPDRHRYIYTADQLREAQVKALNSALEIVTTDRCDGDSAAYPNPESGLLLRRVCRFCRAGLLT